MLSSFKRFRILALLALAGCNAVESNISDPGSLLSRVLPDSLSLTPGQSVQFLAYGDTPQTGSAAVVSVTWTASGGTITNEGVYTADDVDGVFAVVATDVSGRQARARIWKRIGIRQIVLVPAVATVGTGGSLQFGAYGLNGQGDSVAVSVAYNATGGTISSNGRYAAGQIVGTYRVIASAGLLSDTSSVTVTTTPPPVAGVNAVEVAPTTASVVANATFQLHATTRDASGNELTGRTISWTSNNTAAATVNGSGLVTGIAPGNAVISATSEGKTGTSAITVTTVPVATVELAPSTATVNQGSSQQLSVTLRDANGAALTGRSVTWSSSATGVATVSSSGLVQAIGAGGATITAMSEGKSGTMSVTVPPPTVSAAECASAPLEWIWCDDFEQDRLGSYFEYDNAGGNFTRTASVGFNGSNGMRAHFNQGAQSAGALHLAIGATPDAYIRPVDAGTAKYREVYWRMYVKFQAGWVGGGGDKLSRAFVFANNSWAQAAVGHVWSGTAPSPNVDYLLVDPVSGTDASGNLQTTQYNDFAHFNWLGQGKGTLPMFDASHVGQWYCVEAHMKLNTAGSSDGVLETWVNGALQAQRTGLNFLGSYSQYGINAVYFENYWNAGSAASQDRFFDNLVVSTARIGCTS
jgi:hypothetical protein